MRPTSAILFADNAKSLTIPRGALLVIKVIGRWISEFFLKDGRVFETHSGLSLILWGLLKMAGDQNSVVWPSIELIDNLIPGVATTWMAALFIGLLQVSLLVLGRRRSRILPVVLASLFYGMLAESLWAASPGNPLVGMLTLACIVNGYLIVPLVRRGNG